MVCLGLSDHGKGHTSVFLPAKYISLPLDAVFLINVSGAVTCMRFEDTISVIVL